ncbi:DNA-binding transcriptional regulator, MarR family [Micromonospora citrea]|uniref:DNA-binding transcriptional regulator, MarR family n=1 Tax=Micromonospora citrea TaxID=47855 RepID=A0A1C6ULT7_9ACTN|nr:MarR family transcriptional regulator [Micromonospora citrea]SCL54984.1 DNA-binding transcriptional regulator, MarR family [Micromonospora citrea]
MATAAGTGSAHSTAASDAARWDQVTALHAHVEHRLATALQRAHGLGLSEYRALAHLVEAPDGELRMQDLALRIGLNQSSVTRLVGRLIAAGFAYRDLCPDDKRGIYTVVSDAGRTRHDQARGTYEQTLTDALEEMARSAGPQAALVSALRAAG